METNQKATLSAPFRTYRHSIWWYLKVEVSTRVRSKFKCHTTGEKVELFQEGARSFFQRSCSFKNGKSCSRQTRFFGKGSITTNCFRRHRCSALSTLLFRNTSTLETDRPRVQTQRILRHSVICHCLESYIFVSSIHRASRRHRRPLRFLYRVTNDCPAS